MSHEVTVNFNGNAFSVAFSPSWSIARLKNEIARQANTTASEIKVIFAGQELSDSYRLEHCNMNHSVIHAVPMSGQLTVTAVCADGSKKPTLNDVRLESEGNNPQNDNTETATHTYFFVYCKSCQKLTTGKLRCRCSKCKQGSFVLTQGPNCWEDVLTKGRISGRCESSLKCPEAFAEFYFKCGEHRGSDEQAPLSMVKCNIRNIPCLVCMDKEEKLLVFPCDSKHTMCLDCFCSYCLVSLDNRSFVQTERHGYTIPCPGTSESCRTAFIGEPHHFRLLGNDQYERYQRFATEECVLGGEGVLCPGRGCGQGIFPPPGAKNIVCQGGCGLAFCRYCSLDAHSGPCRDSGAAASNAEITGSNRFEVSVDSNQLLRWERQAQDLIRTTTKRCPRKTCGVPIEKNAGCNHMTCTRCKFQWCWVCCKEWSRRCQSNHWFTS